MPLRRGVVVKGRPERELPGPASYVARTHPHVCFVAPHAWPVLAGDRTIEFVGGAEVQQSGLARLFAANGYRVSMICMDFGQPERVAIDGVTVHRAFRPDAGLPLLRFAHPRLTSMWRALEAAGADIYYCRAASMWVGVVAEYCRLRGKRAIYAGASDKDFVPQVGGQIRHGRDRWLYRRGLARVHAIVAQNEQQRLDCLRVHGREARIVPSCYRLPASAQAGQGADRVLWVGVMRAGKQPELFLELAARLPHRRCVMVGGAAEGEAEVYERVRARAAALPNVELTGFLTLAEVEDWFDRARLLVNTSRFEGMPNTFLQAWARGVPTVATVDVGAPVQRVASGVDALAGEAEGLLADAGRWTNASLACRAYFERTYSPAEALGRYARLFDELMPDSPTA